MGHLKRFELEDKIVVVTGAGRGIGRTIALDAVRSGADVAVGSRTLDELKSLSKEIEGMGKKCFYHSLDVVDVASIKVFFDSVISEFGRIDVLINNAGYNKLGKLLDYDEELYDQIVDANLKNVFFCSQVVVKKMIYILSSLLVDIHHLFQTSVLPSGIQTYISYKRERHDCIVLYCISI